MTASAALPIALVIPVVAAAVLMVLGRHGSRWTDAVAQAATVSTAMVLIAVAAGWTRGPAVHWIAGWQPTSGATPGIPLVGDLPATVTAAAAAVLVTASLVYSVRYFEQVRPLYPVLLLTLLTGMIGFVLSGDLFNLFVFYEVIGVSAYALAGYRIHHEGPLQGAINFAVSNTIGSLLLLAGGVFVYARTGTPNLAEAGTVLAGSDPDPLVLAAYALIAAGLFVKAAVVPFHFWHADAHAVAPTPVCALFAAIMIQLGVVVFARVHWVVFADALGSHVDELRAILTAAATLTAVVAAVMATLQNHIKRLLAFSSVAHSGIILAGIAMLDPDGVTGSGIYLVAHAATKAALFLGLGIVLHRYGSVDEGELHGRGRSTPVIGVMFTLGALALAGTPPFGLALGKQLIDGALLHHGHAWLVVCLVLVSGLTAGAVVRVAARVFLGWGRPAASHEAADAREAEGSETEEGHGRTPAVMAVPMAVLLVAALAAGIVPGVRSVAASAGHALTSPDAYRALVLGAEAVEAVIPATPGVTLKGVAIGSAGLAVALLVAAGALLPRRRPRWLGRVVGVGSAAVAPLRAVHSGHVGDYVAWLLTGVAVLGAGVAVLLR